MASVVNMAAQESCRQMVQCDAGALANTLVTTAKPVSRHLLSIFQSALVQPFCNSHILPVVSISSKLQFLLKLAHDGWLSHIRVVDIVSLHPQ